MPGTFFPLLRVSDPDMFHGTSVTQVPRSLSNGFLRSQLLVKRSQNFRCMRNPQFYVSGKRPMPWSHSQTGVTITIRVLVCGYAGKLSQHGAFKCPGVASSTVNTKLLCKLSRLIYPHYDEFQNTGHLPSLGLSNTWKHINIKQWEAITHQWPNFHGSLGKLSLEYSMVQ